MLPDPLRSWRFPFLHLRVWPSFALMPIHLVRPLCLPVRCPHLLACLLSFHDCLAYVRQSWLLQLHLLLLMILRLMVVVFCSLLACVCVRERARGTARGFALLPLLARPPLSPLSVSDPSIQAPGVRTEEKQPVGPKLSSRLGILTSPWSFPLCPSVPLSLFSLLPPPPSPHFA